MQPAMVIERENSSSTTRKASYATPDSPSETYTITPNSNVWEGNFSMPIIGFHSDNYKLKKPLFVQIESYRGGYLATDGEVDRHGMGNTIDEALVDYEENLLDYYESLAEHYPKLSPNLVGDFKILKQIITRV